MSPNTLGKLVGPTWSCARCDVAWRADGPEPCWMCGQLGVNEVCLCMYPSAGAAYYSAADAEGSTAA